MQPMFTLPFHNSGFKFSYMLRSFIPRFLMTAAVVGSSVSLLSARSASAAPPSYHPSAGSAWQGAEPPRNAQLVRSLSSRTNS